MYRLKLSGDKPIAIVTVAEGPPKSVNSSEAGYFVRGRSIALCIGSIVLSIVISQNGRLVAQSTNAESAQVEQLTPSDDSQPLSWQDACKLIGTQDQALAVKAEKMLREALRLPNRTEEMATALLLLCIERHDVDAVLKGLTGMRNAFPKPTAETQGFVARVRLWLWLSTLDPKQTVFAASTFRELVTSTNRSDLPKTTLRAQAEAIGTVCGMLQSNLAASPIPIEDLATAEKCLLGSTSAEVKSSFKLAQRRALSRGEELEKVIERVQGMNYDTVTQDQVTREARLAELGVEFTSTRELAIEIVRNSREIARQNNVDRRKLGDLMNRLEREWRFPTAGHPGQPPIEPRRPQKSDIRVDDYKWETDGYESKTDPDGNSYREPKKKKVRRSQVDIDRERNAEYAQLMERYNFLKADFDRRIVIYIPLLDSWTQADQTRRQKLQQERDKAAARSKELLATNKQLNSEATEAKSGLTEQRSEVEILAEQYELTDIALKAIAAKSISSAFRPPHFQLFDIEQEKSKLLSRVKK